MFAGICGIILVIRKVAELSVTVLLRSAEGHMCPRSKPEPE